MTKPLRIIAMGTGPFAVPSFDAIANADHQIVAVVTRPQPPVKSRGGPPPSPVVDWAESKGLPIERPNSINDPDAIAWLDEQDVDLLVVCDYGQILKPAALAAARLGGINLHGSLLPAYRGAAPVQRAVLSGDSETGITVIHMTPKLDGGPILTTRVTEILPHETSGTLETRLSQIGVAATVEAIGMLVDWDGDSVIGQPQNASKVSKAARLHKSEGEIDWTRTTHLLDCHVRGMQPWPVAFTFFNASPSKPPLRIQVKAASPVDATTMDPIAIPDAIPGKLHFDDGLVVRTGDGWLRIETLQPAGKKEMTGQAFVNGYQPGPNAQFVASSPA